MFAYCNNSPVYLRDQSGEFPVIAPVIVSVVVTLSAISNIRNAVVYNNASDESELSPSSYVTEKPSREEKMEYTKQETQESRYSTNAWRFYSEYTFHEYGWYVTGWALDKNIPLISGLAKKFEAADVYNDEWDDRWYVNVATVVFGLLGI